jgi:16S rRNA (cytosine1402-N4)-methyltransferase
VTGFSHDPVMVDEIVDVFAAVPAGVVLDATLGGGGHAAAILAARADLSILGLDRDPSALDAAGRRLASFGDRAVLQHRRFDDIDGALDAAGVEVLSGALFDLGVSSHQFDVAERGFSYRHDAPLDMRMDPTETRSAADVVNESSVDELTDILRSYADEKFARRIADAIVANRPISTTGELAGIVVAAIPAPARRRGGHPAKRTFQALRIEVNRELEVLPVALDRAVARLASGGRVAVLSYHSGEDRIVKERFRQHETGGCTCPAGLPCGCGAVASVRRVRVTARPRPTEQERNPRSSSARLRVVEAV